MAMLPGRAIDPRKIALTPELDVPRVSGALLLTQRKVMEAMVGAHVVMRALARLQDDVRREYEQLTPLSWFPVDGFNAVVTAVADEVGSDVLAFHAEVLRKSADLTASIIWRIFLRLTSDEALLSRAPVLYSRSYTQGALTAKILAPGAVEVSLRGWPHVPAIQIQGIKILIGTVLKLAGRKGAEVTSERRPTGAVFLATWRI